MVAEFIHIFGSRSKYLAFGLTALCIILIKVYTGGQSSSGEALVMYTSKSPDNVSVLHNKTSYLKARDVVVSTGDSLATQDFIQHFNSIKKVEPLSLPLNIRPTEGPVSFESGTSLVVRFIIEKDKLPSNYQVFYHTQTSLNGSEIGIISKSSLKTSGNTISVNVKSYGNYQLVKTLTSTKSDLRKKSPYIVFDTRNDRHSIIYSNWKE